MKRLTAISFLLMVFFAVQFHAAGEAGNIAGDILKGLFGMLGLVLPWYLIILGILMITRVFMHFSIKTFIVSLVLHHEGHWKHVPHIDGLAFVTARGENGQGLHDADCLLVKVFVH